MTSNPFNETRIGEVFQRGLEYSEKVTKTAQETLQQAREIAEKPIESARPLLNRAVAAKNEVSCRFEDYMAQSKIEAQQRINNISRLVPPELKSRLDNLQQAFVSLAFGLLAILLVFAGRVFDAVTGWVSNVPKRAEPFIARAHPLIQFFSQILLRILGTEKYAVLDKCVNSVVSSSRPLSSASSSKRTTKQHKA